MGLMNGSQWNLVGKMQLSRSLFTTRLGFEPATHMIGLWRPNRLVLRIGSLCICKASGLSVTFHSCPFSYKASLANRRLNLALAYFEKAVDNVIAAKGVRTSDLVGLYEEIAQIEQLRRNHDQAIQYLQQVGGLAEAPARWACLAPGPIPRARDTWASQNRGWDWFSSRSTQETFLNFKWPGQRTTTHSGPIRCVTWFKTAFPLPGFPHLYLYWEEGAEKVYSREESHRGNWT